MSHMIRLEDVAIGYESRAILSSVDLLVKTGQFWGVIGPNGGGKSTLLKTLLGLIAPVSGNVRWKTGLRFGYVPQGESFDPIFPVSVKEVVTMGRYCRVPAGRHLAKADHESVIRSLEKVSIGHLKDRALRSLSGGEKQRTLLARALAGEPDILVLDEPTASLDMKGEAEIMELVESIKTTDGTAVIMVSHFLNTVARYADRIVLIDKDRRFFREGGKSEMLNSGILSNFFGVSIDPDTAPFPKTAEIDKNEDTANK